MARPEPFGRLTGSEVRDRTCARTSGQLLPEESHRAIPGLLGPDRVVLGDRDAPRPEGRLVREAVVRQVPVPSFPRMFDAFRQQQTAVSIATIGQAQLKEWEVALGGVRYLPFDDSPAAVAALNKFIPYSSVQEVKPGPGVTGVAVPTRMLVYDYTLWANSKVSADVVAKVVQALYDNPQALKDTSPLWKEFEPALMSRELGVPYHPGAMRFYQSKALRPR